MHAIIIYDQEMIGIDYTVDEVYMIHTYIHTFIIHIHIQYA